MSSRGIECICIDDTNQPKEIPSILWVKKGEKYTITHICKHINQNNIQGVELAELDISSCFPFSAFKLSRFVMGIEDLQKFMEMLRDCTKLNDIEIADFVKEMLEKEELYL